MIQANCENKLELDYEHFQAVMHNLNYKDNELLKKLYAITINGNVKNILTVILAIEKIFIPSMDWQNETLLISDEIVKNVTRQF